MNKMVERLSDEQWLAVARLCEQGERYLLDGMAPEALALLAQAYEQAHDLAPDLASSASWSAGWLSVRQRDYAQAAIWFSRASDPPRIAGELWPVTREALLHICRELGAAEPAIAPWPALAVTSLGRCAIARDGQALPACRSRKGLAIFRYLLTRQEREAHKAELIELLWPETTQPEATHSLHVAVSALRRYLDPPGTSYLRFEGDRYLVEPGAPVGYDCAEFEQLSAAGDRAARGGDLDLARSQYLAAVERYRGDYTIEAHDRTWALVERERLLTRYLANLDQLGRLAIAQRSFEDAIDFYGRLLARDAYREDAHRQLMRCYWQLGRRGDALQQYRRCAATLADELGLEPLPETQALLQQIMAGAEMGE